MAREIFYALKCRYAVDFEIQIEIEIDVMTFH